jgi:NADH-quinone oxidoreductase subunit H
MNWIATHIPPWVWIAIVVHLAVLGTVAYLILLERKIASWVQDRIGPNRVGLGGLAPLVLLPLAPFVDIDRFIGRLRDRKMFGLGQPLADGLKFILKEDYRPANADKVLFTLAPMIMIIVIIISIAVIPWGGIKQTTRTIPPGQTAESVVPPGATIVTIVSQTPTTVTYQWPFQIANLNIGVLFILAVLSLSVYGVVIGGWASNNKYSFLGGLRATANMISYEVPLGLSVLTIALLFGSLDLAVIVDRQVHYWLGFIPAWNIFCQPLAFVMFLICIHAEANRAPFDLAEAEQELVGGYHTEYSAMRFALFFLAEYAGMITTSAVCVALFFGGWHIPWLDLIAPRIFGDPHGDPAVVTSLGICILRGLVFFVKTLAIIFIFMWVRWSLPRFRFDQLMGLAWRALIPISLTTLMATAVIMYWFMPRSPDARLWVTGTMALVLLAVNAVLLVGFFLMSQLIPAAPDTNRRIRVPGSRFQHTPLPAPISASAAT